MNHFELFNIPVQFYLDEGKLKQKFYELSRKYHPDQHTLAEVAVQDDNLQKSSQTNEAYKILKDFFKRLKYILKLKGVMEDDSRNEKLPQDFLMEMMDVNEEIMDLQMEDDPKRRESLLESIGTLEKDLFGEIRPLLIQHDSDPNKGHDLTSVKSFYLKRQYLLRIQENLDKFASS